MLAALLVAPALALASLVHAIDPWLLIGLPVAVSLFTYAVQRNDKTRAEAGAWRIPEATLHLCELLGGWPGAFLAQRQVRHKVSKPSYQFIFWAIVLLHQFLAVDSLRAWIWTRQLIALAKAQFS